MKKLLVIAFFFLAFAFLPFSVQAYDPREVPNNIYGIHIINHSDLEDASHLVNANGDWGYVTVVITEDQRDKQIWQKFMDDSRRLRLIPIIRVATKFSNNNWEIPKIEEIDNWVTFFNSLNWVIENRYIVIGNEPNHAKEWGGKIDPANYSIYLKTFSQKLKSSNTDYFILNAGFDQDAPNSRNTMDQKRFMDLMVKKTPDVFQYIDGWNSHSYPNPAFSGLVTDNGRRSIRGFGWELELIQKDLPIFITETGWKRTSNNEELIANNLKYAYEEVWMKNKNVVAVTPFILNYTEEPFYNFSWRNKDGSYFPVYETIQSSQKIKGQPKQKISGEVIFSFLNPLMIKNSDHKGYLLVKNTGQAIWQQSESHVINEQALLINESENEIIISNTKFNQIEPFKTGLVVYSLRAPNESGDFDAKLGFYVRGEKVGGTINSKIISF